MTHPHNHYRLRQSGISLVEIMVALVIGLVATLAVMQVFSAFEGQKRTTSGNADAQTNGTVALFAISRNIQRAGFGLFPAEDSAYECSNKPTIDHDNKVSTPEIGLAPIEITDGGNAPDTISIRYGTSQFGGAVNTVTSLATADETITIRNHDGSTVDVTGLPITVRNNMGCQSGDIAVLTNGASCMLRRINATSVKVAGSANYTRILLDDTTDVSSGTTISCLGNWQQAVFSINAATGNLQLNGTDFTNGIVNLQAEYGVSLSANDNTIDSWVSAKDEWKGDISVDNRNRIKAIRLSLVARNALSERDEVTDSPADYGVADTDANKKFRYRRFQTIIPLRNVIWAKATFE